MIWEAAAVAVVFGLVLAAVMFAVFRYAASLVERTMLAAFAKAEKEYREILAPRAKRTLSSFTDAVSVDEALYGSKGNSHPVPDIPPHPGNLGERRDPTDWVSGLGTERVKNRK